MITCGRKSQVTGIHMGEVGTRLPAGGGQRQETLREGEVERERGGERGRDGKKGKGGDQGRETGEKVGGPGWGGSRRGRAEILGRRGRRRKKGLRGWGSEEKGRAGQAV